jgi:hypothetical protein
MEAIACGGLDCLGAALGLGHPRRSLSDGSSGLGTALAPTGILPNASGLWCELHLIDPVSPRGLAGWHVASRRGARSPASLHSRLAQALARTPSASSAEAPAASA